MDAIDCIYSRRSCRKFLQKPMDFQTVLDLIEAGTKAPSLGNIQDYRFVIVSDQDKINHIAEHCTEQYWIAEAPLLIVVASDTERSEEYYGLRGQRLYSIQNASAATQNILLAAHAKGLGACWIGSFDEEYVQDALNMPEHIRPQAIIPVGYPAKSPQKRHEHAIRMFVGFNAYGASIENMNTLLNEYNKEIERAYKSTEKKGKKGLDKLKDKVKKFYEKAKEDFNKRK